MIIVSNCCNVDFEIYTVLKLKVKCNTYRAIGKIYEMGILMMQVYFFVRAIMWMC